MSYVQRHTMTLTTNGSGAATGYTEVVTGRVSSITYTKNNFADGVDFDVTGETSGIVIWDQDNVNATTTVAPRQATHSTAGAAALYAAGGTAVLDYVAIANERIKVVVASGGATTSGTFTIYLV